MWVGVGERRWLVRKRKGRKGVPEQVEHSSCRPWTVKVTGFQFLTLANIEIAIVLFDQSVHQDHIAEVKTTGQQMRVGCIQDLDLTRRYGQAAIVINCSPAWHLHYDQCSHFSFFSFSTVSADLNLSLPDVSSNFESVCSKCCKLIFGGWLLLEPCSAWELASADSEDRSQAGEGEHYWSSNKIKSKSSGIWIF